MTQLYFVFTHGSMSLSAMMLYKQKQFTLIDGFFLINKAYLDSNPVIDIVPRI